MTVSTDKMVEAMEQAAEKVNAVNGEPSLGGLDMTQEQIIVNLKEFVNKHGLALERGGKRYLRVEAWQYLANLLGIYPTFDSASEIMESRSANGKDFRQYVVTTGCALYDKEHREVGRAMMIASNHEPFLKNKQLFATWGMSQTRAFSRAMRNIYGYLVLAAGYQALPWEELGEGGE